MNRNKLKFIVITALLNATIMYAYHVYTVIDLPTWTGANPSLGKFVLWLACVLAEVAFIQFSWYLFERRSITVILKGPEFSMMTVEDKERLWNEISRRIKEEESKDAEDKTSGPSEPPVA